MSNIHVGAALAAGIVLLGLGASAAAQPPSAAGQPQYTGAPPTDAPATSGGANDSQSHAVLRITSVEVIRSAHAPSLDIVRVRAIASSAGWEEAELVPLSRGVPADGILHLIFVARPPEVAADATGYEILEAILPLETGHPFKGVNVHAATNAVSVTALPGYSESKCTLEDCGKCVGKTFIPKGGSGSGGRGEGVREEQVPPQTRIVRPSDGIAEAASNPNRLTLILDKNNRILTAVWE